MVEDVRSHFPILREKVYLYSCSQGALSDAVEEGMRQYACSWRTSSNPWEEWVGAYENLRREFARFINAAPEEVAIVTSASAGINPIASAISFSRRDRVVMGEYEFPTMGHIWLAQEARGAKIQFVDGVNHTVPVERYAAAIDERTAVVALTQVSFLNGFRCDVSEITRIAHERGALVFLDGFQDCGTRPIDVKALGVDFYVTGTLKYLLGPAGLGFLYVRRELIESLTPPVSSWMAQRDVFAYDTKRFDPALEARRFEGGSPAIPNIYMARPAIELLTRAGMENVAARIATLAGAFQEGARDLRIESKTHAGSVGPLIVLRSKNAAEMVARLAARGFVVSARRDGVRFSFHVYNSLEDVAATLRALEENLDLMERM